ncbi:ribonuclease H-like domain-containing protein [Candidatus Woesearchaeota archaeon]|nr:ribonuclease H-like domain-containing protein [Candidatus Woesearchaeota archaeon]
MYDNYFIIDIETCPLNIEEYLSLEEEERTKLLNPIDSKIIALGIRYKNQNIIFMDEDENKILKEFWSEWKRIKDEDKNNIVVGFNLNNFDLSFITSRSFINNVQIAPFNIKLTMDLREKINAYRYGKTRGRLVDYGRLLGLEISDVDGSRIAELCKEKNWEKLRGYLAGDLEITEQLLKRVKETNIINITRW